LQELLQKPDELFGQLVQQAGIPDGVCNIVPGGVDAAEALVAHQKVQKVTFTGGPATARKILAACAQHLKPAVLELGGKRGQSTPVRPRRVNDPIPATSPAAQNAAKQDK